MNIQVFTLSKRQWSKCNNLILQFVILNRQAIASKKQ